MKISVTKILFFILKLLVKCVKGEMGMRGNKMSFECVCDFLKKTFVNLNWKSRSVLCAHIPSRVLQELLEV